MNGTSRRTRRYARPAHPPFTDFPLAAYVFAAAFDVISVVGGSQHSWATQLWHAGTFVLTGGLGVCLITMGTGIWDLIRFPPPSADAAQTVVVHVCVMAGVFLVAACDMAWRLSDYGSRASTPPGLAALSVAVAAAACAGASYGGKLVFGHGIGVAASAVTAGRQSPDEQAADDHGQAADEGAAGAAATQPPPQPGTLA